MRHQETIEKVVSVQGTVVEIPKEFESIPRHAVRLVADKAYPDAATVICVPRSSYDGVASLRINVLSGNNLPCNGKVSITLVGEIADALKPHHMHTSRENRITDPLVWLEREHMEIEKKRGDGYNPDYATFIRLAGVAERRRRQWVREQKQKAKK